MMRIRTLRRFFVVVMSAVVATGWSVATAAPASADTLPPSPYSPCSSSQFGVIDWTDPVISTVAPTVTDFNALEIAPGTTGVHTATLSTVRTVTRTITNADGTTVDADAGFDVVFVKFSSKVAITYNKTVADQDSTASTTTETMTENFNEPGRYGLYRGTYTVVGDSRTVECRRTDDLPPGPDSQYLWMDVRGAYNFRTHDYDDASTYAHITVFTSPERGVVVCGSTPIGDVAKVALTYLGCPS